MSAGAPPALDGAYLVLDLGNGCPLACRHCIQREPRRHAHFDRLGVMRPALAEGLLEDFTLHGKLPEPLRIAHLVAGALGRGESRGRA